VSINTDKTAVLIVDDEKAIRDILYQALKGRFKTVTAENGAQGLQQIQARSFQLALLDVQMPGMDGIQLLEEIGRRSPDTAVVMISGVTQVDTALECIKKGAYDYVTKPFSLNVVISCIGRALERRRLILENRAYQQNLESQVQVRTAELQEALGRIETVYDETIKALGAALDLRDSETEHHCLRVSSFVLKLARKSGISEKDRLKDIEWGAFLHDIGKIGVPDAILKKPGRLTEAEREIIRTHPVLGYQMLQKIPFLKGAVEIVFSHHESYDGSGYPQGLAGEGIPLSARLFAVADTIDAMTSDRPYRKALPIQAAGSELKRLSGKQFDPRIVDVFFSIPSCEWSM